MSSQRATAPAQPAYRVGAGGMRRDTPDAMTIRARRIVSDHSRHDQPYHVSFRGLDLVVLPGVFSPTSTPSTALLADNLTVCPADRVLEIGTGSGALALLAATSGAATVVATDISPEAVACARRNVAAAGANVDVRVSDLFESLGSDERFSLIIFNPPFGDAQPGTMLERSVFDYHHATLDRFLRQAPSHLVEGGRIAAVFGGMEDELELSRRARRYRYHTRVLSDTFLEVHLVVYELTCTTAE